MSDLISRSALMEELNNYISHTDERNSEHYVCKRIKKIIEDAPTVEARPSVEWIPCEVVDHPEHCRDCEVTRKDTVGYVRDIAFYTDKWRRLEDEMQIDVIAWKEPSSPYDADMRGRKNE